MTLLPDWKSVLTRAWSIKFLVAAAAVSGCETIVSISGTTLFPPGVASAVTGVLSALGILARVLAQKEAEDVAGK